MEGRAMANVPVTKVRIQVPRGMKIEDVFSSLELSFEDAPDSGIEFNTSYCCVDVAVAGPFSTIADNGGGSGGNTA
jgi:hypothetical protein